MVRRILIALAVVIVAIQFVPVDRTNPPVTTPLRAPDDVMAVLRESCFDCHSNETSWPWYSRVAPVSWLLADHVHEARSDLDFSEWPLDPEEQAVAMNEMRKMIREGKMPLRTYVWGHPGAALDDAEKALLLTWLGGS